MVMMPRSFASEKAKVARRAAAAQPIGAVSVVVFTADWHIIWCNQDWAALVADPDDVSPQERSVVYSRSPIFDAGVSRPGRSAWAILKRRTAPSSPNCGAPAFSLRKMPARLDWSSCPTSSTREQPRPPSVLPNARPHSLPLVGREENALLTSALEHRMVWTRFAPQKTVFRARLRVHRSVRSRPRRDPSPADAPACGGASPRT
jgi:hypothetical protein